MEIPTWVSYASAWLAAAALVLITGRFLLLKKPNLPPGPKPWPLIGNLNLLMGPLLHRNIHNLVLKHGPIMQLKFGSHAVVIGSSTEIAEAILKTHDLKLADRPTTAAGKFTAYNYPDIIWSQYGPYWRQLRRICIMELFSPKRLQQFEHVRVEEFQKLLGSLFLSSGKPINAKDQFLHVSLSIISRLVLGKNYIVETGNEKAEIMTPKEYREMLDELFLLNGVFDIGDAIPWFAFMDLQGYVKRMKAVAKKFDGFLEHVVEKHNVRRKGVKDYEPKDILDIILKFADDPNLEIKLDRVAVKALTMNMIAGGTESSSVITEWAMAELLKKPEVSEKVNEELDRVIGRERWVEEKDMINLKYVNARIKETVRLHPPLLLPRLAREYIQIAGYEIPKGTRVMVNVWTVSRDPKIWENPNELCPERFIGKAIDVKGHNFELLPFGAGRRMCPGYPFGLKVVQVSIANLLHGFKWKLPGDMNKDDLDMEETFGLTIPKRVPLLAVLEPRLPSHLYAM